MRRITLLTLAALSLAACSQSAPEPVASRGPIPAFAPIIAAPSAPAQPVPLPPVTTECYTVTETPRLTIYNAACPTPIIVRVDDIEMIAALRQTVTTSADTALVSTDGGSTWRTVPDRARP